jgi:hypothetical protein
MQTMRRHGDLPVHPVTKLPAGKEVKHNGSFVLAEGETTGHCHRITVEKPQDLMIFDMGNGLYALNLTSQATISHEEHKTIVVQPGQYVVGREQEYDYFANAVRRVID